MAVPKSTMVAGSGTAAISSTLTTAEMSSFAPPDEKDENEFSFVGPDVEVKTDKLGNTLGVNVDWLNIACEKFVLKAYRVFAVSSIKLTPMKLKSYQPPLVEMADASIEAVAKEFPVGT
jgi:hypothetical protein